MAQLGSRQPAIRSNKRLGNQQNDDHLPNAPPQAILQALGLKAKKSWGQNFLHDPGILAFIANAACAKPDDTIVELGAGLGGLTRLLATSNAKVIAVERDRELIPILQHVCQEFSQVEVLEADAASLMLGPLCKKASQPLVVVGNLPYQISSRILVSLADQAPHISHAVLMVQHEVAQRVCAQPGSRTYGLLTVLVQRAFKPHLLRTVLPGAFFPVPRVRSAVLNLQTHPNQLTPSEDSNLVVAARASFSGRRKILVNSLMMALGDKRADILRALAGANISPNVRAETLALADFIRLGEALSVCGLIGAKRQILQATPKCKP